MLHAITYPSFFCYQSINETFPIRLDEPKSTAFVTTFESGPDGIKSTSRKVTQSENVIVEEVLSEPEQEKEAVSGNVVIEEIQDEEEGKSTQHSRYQIKINTTPHSTYMCASFDKSNDHTLLFI